MSDDARFEDGGETPLRLLAADGDDIAIISALCQDAVLPASEIKWDRKRHRFALLVNRFRWEDAGRAEQRKRGFERVQTLLVIEHVLKVQSLDLPPRQPDMVLSLLSLSWEPGAEGAGRLLLTLAGDAQIAVEVEALEARLSDVTRPWLAPTGKEPRHDEG